MTYEIATFQFGCTIAQHLICPSFKAMHNQFQRYVHQPIERNFLSIVKYSSLYFYWVYYECGGRKELCTDLTLVIQAIERRVPSSFQPLSRAHVKGSQQIPVETSLTYLHVIFPKLMALKRRKNKDQLNVKIKYKMSDNWKKIILWIDFSDRMGIWVGILEVLKIHPLEPKAFPTCSYCVAIQLAGHLCFRVLLSFSRSYPSIYCYHINNYKSPFFTFNVFV